MILKEKKDKKEKKGMGITSKMFLSTFFFTIIPLFITGLLITYTYQDMINNLLAKEDIHLSEEVIEGLFSAMQGARIQSILTVFIVIILISFSNIIISRNLTRPLRRLIKGADEIARGNFDFKTKVESKDELGELSVHFDDMGHQLKEAKTSIEGAKDILEIKVQERTKELEKATESLEESKNVLEIKVLARTRELEEFSKGLDGQVKQKTKELQEKLEEMEKFQKLSIGRELKMVELKEEIKKLKGEN